MAALWFYTDNGVQRGPVLAESLQALADRGLLKAGDRVRNEDTSDWAPAERLLELLDAPGSAESAAAKPAPHDLSATPTPKRWQFSLGAMLGAVSMIAVACGVSSLVIRSGELFSLAGAGAVLLVATMIGGAIGGLGGNLQKGLMFGALSGLVLCPIPLRSVSFMIPNAIVLLFFA